MGLLGDQQSDVTPEAPQPAERRSRRSVSPPLSCLPSPFAGGFFAFLLFIELVFSSNTGAVFLIISIMDVWNGDKEEVLVEPSVVIIDRSENLVLDEQQQSKAECPFFLLSFVTAVEGTINNHAINVLI